MNKRIKKKKAKQNAKKLEEAIKLIAKDWSSVISAAVDIFSNCFHEITALIESHNNQERNG